MKRTGQFLSLTFAVLLLAIGAASPETSEAKPVSAETKSACKVFTEFFERAACEDCVAQGGKFLSNEYAMACVRDNGSWFGCSKIRDMCNSGGGPGGKVSGDLRTAPKDPRLAELLGIKPTKTVPVQAAPQKNDVKPVQTVPLKKDVK